jgi:hypothetical protein
LKKLKSIIPKCSSEQRIIQESKKSFQYLVLTILDSFMQDMPEVYNEPKIKELIYDKLNVI